MARRIEIGRRRTLRCYQYPDFESFLAWHNDHDLAAILIETPFSKTAPYEMRRAEQRAIRALLSEWARDFDPVAKAVHELIEEGYRRGRANPYSDRAITVALNRRLQDSGIVVSRAAVRSIVARERQRLAHHRAVAHAAVEQLDRPRRTR